MNTQCFADLSTYFLWWLQKCHQLFRFMDYKTSICECIFSKENTKWVYFEVKCSTESRTMIHLTFRVLFLVTGKIPTAFQATWAAKHHYTDIKCYRWQMCKFITKGNIRNKMHALKQISTAAFQWEPSKNISLIYTGRTAVLSPCYKYNLLKNSTLLLVTVN